VRYTDFFVKFYMGRSTGGILGHKSKEKIPEYFMKAALIEDYYDRLPTSNSSYGKWFDGTRNPEDVLWGLIVSHFDEDGFIDKVSKDLNDSVLLDIMVGFNIVLHEGETPDKRLFAFALAKQFYAIAQGCGNADEIAKDFYIPDAYIIAFPEYANRTKLKYEKTKTPFSDGEERLLEDVYVCNILSSRLSATKNRHNRTQERTILNASLDSISAYSNRVILVANGGMGKSMMLQHLFLDSIQKHLQTGILPIMIELRDFSESNDLFDDYIVKTAETFDENLTKKKIADLMSSGKCQILLDGADEIDLSDVNSFQRQIAELIDRYPYNQYVMASRDCDIIRGVQGFAKLYLRPFNGDQSSTLINNLLADLEDETIKDEIAALTEGEYLKKHSVFASNPMLLTFVIMKHLHVNPFEGKKRLFYRTVYDAIVYGHDEEKKGYSRVFRSAQNAEEFTKVFKEFCAVTYMKHETEFDLDTFDGYFNNLTSKDTLENPNIMSSKNFIHDACTTACMMYEEDIKLLYIDPGFQEYLFALYYYSAEPEELETLGRTLWNIPVIDFDGYDAFEMLCEFSLGKFENCLLKPYLHNIFSATTEIEKFVKFLRHGYSEFEYQVIDTDKIAKYTSENNADWISLKPIIIEPSNIIFMLLLQQLDIDNYLSLEPLEEAFDYPEFMTAGIFGELYLDPVDRKKTISPHRLLRQHTIDVQAYERTHEVESYIRDDQQQLVCFGHEYKIDFDKVLEAPENYSDLINVLNRPENDVLRAYNKVKEYYEELIN